MSEYETEHRPTTGGSLTAPDPTTFEALYQGEEVSFETGGAPLAAIPWQLDGPQPAVVALADAGEIVDPVLECGCGLGDNAVFLAGRGHRVTAVDASPSAIEHARATAAGRGLDVRFLVADATELADVPQGFRTAVDSALLHCLDRPARRAYLAALARVCAPGARLHVLCFGPGADPVPVPAGLDEQSLRADLAHDWTVERMRVGSYTTGLSRQAWREKVAPAIGSFPPDLDGPDGVDDRGRVLLPMWEITATRN